MTVGGRWMAVLVACALVSGGCVGAQRHRALQQSYDDLATRYEANEAQTRDLRLLVDAMHAALRATQADVPDHGLAAFYDQLLNAFAPQLEAEQVAVMVYPDRVTLALADGVHFETGSDALTGLGEETLRTLAEVLERHPERRFVVEGHTDAVPIATARFADNWELGAARALAVADALAEAGVSRDRLSAASFADTAPLGTNDSDEGRARNRRVEIAFQPTLDEIPGYERIVEAAARVIHAEGTPGAPAEESDAISSSARLRTSEHRNR